MNNVFGGVFDGIRNSFDFVSGVNDGQYAMFLKGIYLLLNMDMQSWLSDIRMENLTARSFSSKQMQQLSIGS